MITSIDGDSATLFLSELKTMDSVYSNIHIYPVVSEQEKVIQNIISNLQKVINFFKSQLKTKRLVFLFY